MEKERHFGLISSWQFYETILSITTSWPSDPVDFEIFTGDVFQNFLTGLSIFSPGSNIKTIMTEVENQLRLIS